MNEEWQKAQQEKIDQLRRKHVEENQKRQILQKILDGPAFERIQNVRLANPDLYDQLVGLLVQLVQSGQIRGKVTESQLLSILGRVQDVKKEPKITFKRK
ncbi:DNA-binding protein [Candidatus Micrarchaeota archaeon]|nr:DNA-binding protein [Candidatus Micrarchaeota archaeon]